MHACKGVNSRVERDQVIMVCKFFSLQAIPPQYLNIVTSNCVQRFLRGLQLGIFTLIKNIQFYHISLSFVELLRYLVMRCSHFNAQYTSLVVQWGIQVFDWNFAPISAEIKA